MTSFESMKKKHEQTGLYRVTEDSNIGCELKAYSAGLDVLYDMLDEMERECFVETAVSYGLSMREQLLGYERQELDVEKRRKILKYSEQISADCTVEDFRKILDGYGLDSYDFTESFSTYTINIYIYDSLTDSQKAKLNQRIIDDFPFHLRVNVYYMK